MTTARERLAAVDDLLGLNDLMPWIDRAERLRRLVADAALEAWDEDLTAIEARTGAGREKK